MVDDYVLLIKFTYANYDINCCENYEKKKYILQNFPLFKNN